MACRQWKDNNPKQGMDRPAGIQAIHPLSWSGGSFVQSAGEGQAHWTSAAWQQLNKPLTVEQQGTPIQCHRQSWHYIGLNKHQLTPVCDITDKQLWPVHASVRKSHMLQSRTMHPHQRLLQSHNVQLCSIQLRSMQWYGQLCNMMCLTMQLCSKCGCGQALG